MEEPQIPSVLWIYCALGFFFPSFLLNYYAHLHEKGILVSQSSSAPVAIYSSLIVTHLLSKERVTTGNREQ